MFDKIGNGHLIGEYLKREIQSYYTEVWGKNKSSLSDIKSEIVLNKQSILRKKSKESNEGMQILYENYMLDPLFQLFMVVGKQNYIL